MGVTVNHWLVEFDSLMRSQVVNGLDALMVGQRAVTPWLRQVGSIPTQLTSINGVYSVVEALLSVKE